MIRFTPNPALFVAIVLMCLGAAGVTAQESVIRIEGRSEGPEGRDFPYSVFVIHPGGDPLSYRWDFGDGSSPVEGENLSSISHRFRADDDFTVSLSVTGGDGTVLSSVYDVTVTNARPVVRELAARPDLELADAYEFTAEATDWSSDELTYIWDFGDGTDPVSGVDLTKVSHAYTEEGKFTVTLKVEDEDGAHREKQTTIYTGPSQWSGKVSGDLSGELSGEVLPFRGLWASPIEDRCRLLLTLWDDDAQVYLNVIVDPETLSRGFTYTSRAEGSIWLSANTHDPAYFQNFKKIHANEIGIGGMVDLAALSEAAPGDKGEVEDRRAKLERTALNRVGVNPFQQRNPLARPASPTPPPAGGGGHLSPTADPEHHFRSSGGTMKCAVNPDTWIRCELDLSFANTDDDEKFVRNIALDGSFFINLPDAMADGVYRGRACDEGEGFSVKDAEPDPEDRYAGFDTTTVRVLFNRAYEPSSVTRNTVKIGIYNPEGEFERLPGRFFHREDKPRTLRYITDKPFPDGVYIHGQIKGGEDGLRSRDDETLGEDARWRFSTVPDLVTSDADDGPGMVAEGPRTEQKTEFALARFEPTEGGGDVIHAIAELSSGSGGVVPAQSGPSGFVGPIAPGVNVRCHVYQSVRDAPLVEGKPATIRVYAEWVENTSVREQDRVKWFPADVTIEDAAGQQLFKRRHHFVRPDLYEAKGLRTERAEHTANFHGWLPQGADGSPLKVTLKVPKRLPPGATQAKYQSSYVGHCSLAYWKQQPELTFDWYTLEMGSWITGVPGDQAAIAARIARRAENYSKQNFPVLDITGRNRGPFSFGVTEHMKSAGELAVGVGFGFAFDVQKGFGSGFELSSEHFTTTAEYRDKAISISQQQLMAYFQDTLTANGGSGADIIVGFVPIDERSGGEAFYDGYDLSDWDPHGEEPPTFYRRTVMLGTRADIPKKNALTHEFGHTYGLHHIPDVADDAARELECGKTGLMMSGIDGMRLEQDGSDGFNKHSLEGNAESVQMQTLMYPCARLKDVAFIAHDQYLKLQKNIEFDLAHGTRSASNRPDDAGNLGFRHAVDRGRPGSESGLIRTANTSAESGGGLLVSGFFAPAGDGVALLPVQEVGSEAIVPPVSGDFKVELRSSNGGVLHRVATGPREVHSRCSGPSTAPDDEWKTFSVVVPDLAGAATLAVARGGTTLVEVERSGRPPVVDIIRPEAGDRVSDTIDLAWEASAPGGGGLAYDIDLSTDRGVTWSPVARALRRTEHSVDSAGYSASGPVSIRVVARVGLDRGEAILDLEVDNPAQVVAMIPEEGSRIGPRARIEAILGSPAPESAQLGLEVAGGKVVPVISGRADEGRVLWVQPETELAAGSAVTVVATGLETEVRFAFTVEADTTAPRVVETVPASGALAVRIDEPFRVFVTEPLDPSTVTSTTLRLIGPDGRTLAGAVAWDAETTAVVLTPGESLLASQVYRIEWGTPPTDPTGNALTGADSWSFTAASSAWGG